MDRKLELKVGQEVAIRIESGSNVSRYLKSMTLENIDEWCFSGEVIKSGRKYITVKFNGGRIEQFNTEDEYRNKYTYGGADYKLYLTKQDVIEEYKSEELYRDIKDKHFGGYGGNRGKFTLDQLERIISIINE